MKTDLCIRRFFFSFLSHQPCDDPSDVSGDPSEGRMFVFHTSENIFTCRKQNVTSAQHCALFSGLNVTFVLITTSMNWTEAQSYCREHHTDLASVRNTAENQKVNDTVPAGHVAWIGLFRDSWKWSDGSSSSFKDWAPGEPEGGNQACVVVYLRSDGTWRDNPCDQNRPFPDAGEFC
uniref:C-type lectin domain-containing protein n=1 Tax=Sparus aurata TaxID=8175 RepID=A0A671YPN2_SPAAU